MATIAVDAGAGKVSAELVRPGIAAGTRVHVVVEVVGEESDAPHGRHRRGRRCI